MDNIYDNKMFCVKEAWHTKGIRVDKEVTAKQAIELAKLNYQVQKIPLYAKDADGQEIKSDFYGTLNAENKKILGVVTDHYQIVQNMEAFDFFDEVVKSGEAIMKCPSCKKILKNVRVYSQYYQDASLKGNKIVEYMGELVFLEILEIGCPKCGELLTSYIKE